MNSLAAAMMGEAHRHKELMVFDWAKATRLIEERRPSVAEAGLEGDFGHTCGEIWRAGGLVMDEYTYLASTWARPMLVLDGVQIECFVMQSERPSWDARTKWPAL